MHEGTLSVDVLHDKQLSLFVPIEFRVTVSTYVLVHSYAYNAFHSLNARLYNSPWPQRSLPPQN